jgi:quercetin dioxygenase-like cupin family protein
MTAPFTHIDNLLDMLPEIPPDSIVSRTFYEDDQVRAILFGFAPGQELSEHTASKPALLYFLEGEAHLTLGEQAKAAQPGTWVHMTPHLPHSIVADSRLVMLLLLLE